MSKERLLNIRRKIKDAISRGQQIARSEDRGVGWGVWRSGISLYEEYFRPIFSTPFVQFLETRKSEGRGTYTLDLMSLGTILRELPIYGGVALGLGDGRSEKEKRQDRAKDVILITGNVLTRKPYRMVKEWIRQKQRDGFDLIICRPYGALTHTYIPENKELYYLLLNRAWHLLSRENGLLLTEVPLFLHSKGGVLTLNEMNQWLNTLKEESIEVEYKRERALKLVKNHHSPLNLPTLTTTSSA